MTQKVSNSSDDQFNNTFNADPVKLSHPTIPSSAQTIPLNSKLIHFGEYEQFKLTKFLTDGSSSDSSNFISLKEPWKAEVIEILKIHGDSLVLEEGEHFASLMKKYAQREICLVGVTGAQEAGKSFFCDKIYNLAEVKGNNFCLKNQPGLYTCSTPFLKGNLCIFLVEIGGCQIKSAAYRILLASALVLCSSLVFIQRNNEGDTSSSFSEFMKAMEKEMQAFDFSNTSFSNSLGSIDVEEGYLEFFPKKIYILTRSPTENLSAPTPALKFFVEEVKKLLPDALTPGYKGNKRDLLSCPFMAKECVSPEYIKETSAIFTAIYEDAIEKSYRELIITATITGKIVQCLVTRLNRKKQIKLHKLYDEILRDIYISAYNLCVTGYHHELELFLGDELPKDVDALMLAFAKASNHAFEQFREYKFHKEMHKQFEKRLQAHIDSKEVVLANINKKKTVEHLYSHFRKLNLAETHPRRAIKMLLEEEKEMTHGRGEAISSFLASIYISTHSLPEFDKHEELQTKQRIEQRIASGLQQLQKLEANQREEDARSRRIMEQFFEQKANSEKHIEALTKRYDELQRHKNILQGNSTSPKKTVSKEELLNRREELLLTKTDKNKELIRLRGEDDEQVLKQLEAPYRERIAKCRASQEALKSEISNQDPMQPPAKPA